MSDGIYFWNYSYLAGQTLSVWCAGLDCGDHAVNDDGSVFVPWQSDPDALFTKDYLIALSNDPPNGGFGASACNIDLSNEDDTTTRVTVDLAIGLPYTSEVQVLRPNDPSETNSEYGPSLAETRRLHDYGMLVANTQSLSIGTTEDNLRPIVFTDDAGDKYPDSSLFTGVYAGLLDCDYDFDGMMLVQMYRPYPATISALIGFIKTYDRE